MTPSEFGAAISPLFPGKDSVTQVIFLAGAAALLLTPAEHLAPAHPQPLFKRKGLLLDATIVPGKWCSLLASSGEIIILRPGV